MEGQRGRFKDHGRKEGKEEGIMEERIKGGRNGERKCMGGGIGVG